MLKFPCHYILFITKFDYIFNTKNSPNYFNVFLLKYILFNTIFSVAFLVNFRGELR